MASTKDQIEKLKKEPSIEEIFKWNTWIGESVKKRSGKPFKGGFLTAKAVNIKVNPHSGKHAFELSDGSVVDCYQVELVEDLNEFYTDLFNNMIKGLPEDEKKKMRQVLTFGLILGRNEILGKIKDMGGIPAETSDEYLVTHESSLDGG